MTDTTEAVRLADELTKWARDYATTDYTEEMATKAAALLRRIPELESSRLAPSVHEMNYRAAMTALENVKAERDQLRAELEKLRVPEGWKLVPVEPTREMWAAVNKLDDEMAAGGYDGKGCSIEQAWNCLLDFVPTPPNADQKGQ